MSHLDCLCNFNSIAGQLTYHYEVILTDAPGLFPHGETASVYKDSLSLLDRRAHLEELNYK